jgi:hypothetical protein
MLIGKLSSLCQYFMWVQHLINRQSKVKTTPTTQGTMVLDWHTQ